MNSSRTVRAPRVLLVEDDLDLAGMYAERLKHGQLIVESINNGRDALARLQQPNAPDALVLDLMLPGVTGFDILKYIASQPRLKKLPVIIYTAFADDDHRQQAADLGFHDYHLKTHLTPGGLADLLHERLAS